MKNANFALWIVSVTSLGVAAASVVLWTRAAHGGDQHELVVRDEDGHARIRLVATRAGARVEVLDDKQRVVASLSQDGSKVGLALNRTDNDVPGIQLVVPSAADSATSRARVTVRSQGGDTATLGAGTEASVELMSGQGTLELSQGKTRSRINAVNAYNWGTLEVEKDKSKFSTKIPLSVDSAGGPPTDGATPN